ncbi:hypothetical protein P7K49_032608 [Saguinus oedipus]|uniref:Uncharacterized protein n=1 Tax=Saguinus oedipus TaxID=9490 RepID=A0ABQ9TYP9_SAGOE|nr:hypothetical protein P7K49_032608 [Saguinus oedipus]
MCMISVWAEDLESQAIQLILRPLMRTLEVALTETSTSPRGASLPGVPLAHGYDSHRWSLGVSRALPSPVVLVL